MPIATNNPGKIFFVNLAIEKVKASGKMSFPGSTRVNNVLPLAMHNSSFQFSDANFEKEKVELSPGELLDHAVLAMYGLNSSERYNLNVAMTNPKQLFSL
ncbi:uncharacterized protein A1O9_12860 [Exophiala aquamarina CBS 119918]|uniref:Uncharacterized protein n=1 Tax=Exophiala aquamarina CBS 119918 TaxID=1182545 RepID=A0A072NVL2_9EURO|nr:uncharacterized protein A1O9_12860 [Exophiala aquamarina CBS 119918]KEF51078.1 hypothetical protein A1O9_12860 [Exophiala aquamarina CBS 119918]